MGLCSSWLHDKRLGFRDATVPTILASIEAATVALRGPRRAGEPTPAENLVRTTQTHLLAYGESQTEPDVHAIVRVTLATIATRDLKEVPPHRRFVDAIFARTMYQQRIFDSVSTDHALPPVPPEGYYDDGSISAHPDYRSHDDWSLAVKKLVTSKVGAGVRQVFGACKCKQICNPVAPADGSASQSGRPAKPGKSRKRVCPCHVLEGSQCSTVCECRCRTEAAPAQPAALAPEFMEPIPQVGDDDDDGDDGDADQMDLVEDSSTTDENDDGGSSGDDSDDSSSDDSSSESGNGTGRAKRATRQSHPKKRTAGERGDNPAPTKKPRSK